MPPIKDIPSTSTNLTVTSAELSSSPPGGPGRTGSAELSSSPPGVPGKANDPTRCFACSKKVGLLGFKCRCAHVYCSRHRYADDHQCPIDYKQMEQEKIRKENPLISNPKVPKI